MFSVRGDCLIVVSCFMCLLVSQTTSRADGVVGTVVVVAVVLMVNTICSVDFSLLGCRPGRGTASVPAGT